MSQHNRVMWYEGMFMLPQHFQYQDAFHQHQQAQATMRGTPFFWGVQALELDSDALAEGRLQLTRLKLVFPDGTAFDAPQHDLLPPARNLNELFKAAHLKVFVALRLSQPAGANYQDDTQATHIPRRFCKRFDALPDLNEGDLESEITRLRLNPVLLIEGDDLDGYTACPLLRLVRDTTGGFRCDEQFVPPALHLGAHPTPLVVGKRLLAALQGKSQLLGARRRERGDQVVEFGSSDVTLFWLLNTVNRAYAQLAHLLQHPGVHPEQLYRCLAELTGSLLTFSLRGELTDIPAYDHQDPAPALLKLDALIRDLLDNVVPSQCIVIDLEQNKPSFYTGRLRDPRLADADFYIAVQADMPGAKLLELVPRAFKVGAPDEIEVVVNAAMPGVVLNPVSRLPSAIALRLDNHYFAIEPQGKVYERMMASQAICFYVPNAFKDLKLELMAVPK